MSLENTMRLSQAARIIGVHPRTLAAWLRADLGIAFEYKRGSSRMVRSVDVETVQRLHSGQRIQVATRRRA